MNYFSSDFKLGILGGGQLGRMLLRETQKFDIHTSVLDNSKEAPCATIADTFTIGNLNNYEDVYRFGKTVDVLTIEIEHVNIQALLKLEEEGLQIFPQPKVLKIIKNKGLQKQFYLDNHIPTISFKHFNSLTDLKQAKLNFPFIWKSTEFGYDGNGVKKINTINELETLPDIACIVEDLVDIKTELAVIVAQNKKGEIRSYPVVEMEFNATINQVAYVISPARISEKIAKKTTDVALKVAKDYGHIGLLAVEFFLTQDGDILVNEVAPRPHNSGHFSIEGSITNQFEQHIRAILDLPLGNPANKINSVMVNLVGAENQYGAVFYENIQTVLQLEGVTPHIYGKKQTKPNRKMGHLTVVHTDLQKAIIIAKKAKKTVIVKRLTSNLSLI